MTASNADSAPAPDLALAFEMETDAWAIPGTPLHGYPPVPETRDARLRLHGFSPMPLEFVQLTDTSESRLARRTVRSACGSCSPGPRQTRSPRSSTIRMTKFADSRDGGAVAIPPGTCKARPGIQL